MGQKIEAQALKVSADNRGFQIKGDVRINGTAASLDYRKLVDSPEADVQVRATLDEAARARFGFGTGTGTCGAGPGEALRQDRRQQGRAAHGRS